MYFTTSKIFFIILNVNSLVYINYPVTYKITSFSKLKKESEEEKFIEDSLIMKKFDIKQNINFFNLMNDFEYENIQNSANLTNLFFDGIAKFDNLSHFLKGRIYFNILNHIASFCKDLTTENYKDKVFESKNNI